MMLSSCICLNRSEFNQIYLLLSIQQYSRSIDQMKSNTLKQHESPKEEGNDVKMWSLNSQNQQTINRTNHKYCQEYSFNRNSYGSKQQNWTKEQNNRLLYRANHNLSQQSSLRSQSELFKKYNSIYNELIGVEDKEIIRLFLQEIQQNQNNSQKINQQIKYIKKMQEQNISLKALLDKKRQIIAKLCQTETYNLNMIQLLQKKVNQPDFNRQNHFQAKCRQLETYINEFIQSTNEMKEQFMHNYKVIKSQNIRLSNYNDKLNQEILEVNRKHQIIALKSAKIQKSITIMKEKESLLNIKIQALQEQIGIRLAQIQNLNAQLQHGQKFQEQLTIQNKELSNQLDFIRQKINQNQVISRDLFKQMEQQSQQLRRAAEKIEKSDKQILILQNQLNKLKKQKEKADILANESAQQRVQLLNQKQHIIESYEQMRKECEGLKADNHDLIELIDQKDKQADELRLALSNMQLDYSKLQSEYSEQSGNKEIIKQQLIELANQVKFMESTYEKQFTQNQQIKAELQNFWKKKQKRNVLKQICLNQQEEKIFSKSESKIINESLLCSKYQKHKKCWKNVVS